MSQISRGPWRIEPGTNHHHSIETHLCPMTSNLGISKSNFWGLKENLSSNFEGPYLQEYWSDSCVSWIIDWVQSSTWRWWMIQKKSSFWNFWYDEADSIDRMNKMKRKIKFLENQAWSNQIQPIMTQVAFVSFHDDKSWDLENFLRILDFNKSVWEPGKKAENLLEKVFFKIELIPMWAIDS